MIIIQQTTKPIASGTIQEVNIFDSAGNPLLSNGANALQVEQPVAFTSAVLTALTNILTELTNGSNSGQLNDETAEVTLTGAQSPLPSQACKAITLVALSTNTSNINYASNGGTVLTLEPGYSVKLNVSNANLVEVSQSAGETLEYIITT